MNRNLNDAEQMQELKNSVFFKECILHEPDEHLLPRSFQTVLFREYLESQNLLEIEKETLLDGLNAVLDTFHFMLVMPRISPEALQGYLQQKKIDEKLASATKEAILDQVYFILREEYHCYPVLINGDALFVLSLKKEEGDAGWDSTYRRLEELLSSRRRLFLQNLGFVPQIIACEVTDELKDMPKALHTTAFSCDYVFNIFPKKTVVTPLLIEERVRYQNGMRILKPEKERNFFESVIKHNFAGAQKGLKEMILDDRQTLTTVLAIRESVRDRLQWTISLLGLPGDRDVPELREVRDCVELVNSCKSLPELSKVIERFFTTVESYYEKHAGAGSDKLQLVMKYIANNYANQDLSVNSICEVFHVTPEHLSRSFKKKTGVKLIDYIHLTRLSHAKALMEEPLSLGQISTKVGYYGEWSLARAFKRFEGMTPREYRLHANR